ncbi:hypothetical protein VZT92_017572, partial [Zoarces viviparus]
MLKAIGVCALHVRIGVKQVTHLISVVPQLHPPFFVGAGLLVRLGAILDTVHQVLWSQASAERYPLITEPEHMVSGQTIPQACQVASETGMTVPARTAGVPIRLAILKGQKLPSAQAFFQPLPRFGELNLTVCGTPLLEVNNRSSYVLVQNLTYSPIQVTGGQPLGMLVDQSFHDFELTVPVVGELPPSLAGDGDLNGLLYTFPTKMIAIVRHEMLQSEAIHNASLSAGGDMIVYTLTTSPGDATSEVTGTHPPTDEPYPGFEAEMEQQLTKSDAPTTETQRDALRHSSREFREIFSKDSNDCGVTDLHTARIPTDPQAQPTFVRQYRIPLAAYDSIQEILDKLLEEQIIRECNSTYHSPIWPVLKPTGKWRLTIDYIANGFWTMRVDPVDQYKLAFSFGNRQYTGNRCPFGYSNSPAEFNIFLHKAMADASARGNLIYVDDILMRSRTFEEHLAKIRHVLGQLAAAGAKLAITKGQWCLTKVKYVGLTVGADGIEPLAERIQAIRNIKAPTSVSELRSFLGVCNYSRQFIEDYADI